MRRTLAAAAVGIMAVFSSPASADLPVVDLAQLKEWVAFLPIAEDQLKTLVDSYNALANVYNTAERIDASIQRVYFQAQQIYETLQRLTNPNNYAIGLLLPTMRNPMPFSSQAASGYFTGMVSPANLPFGSVYSVANTVGQLPRELSFMATEITRDVQAITAHQAVATNNFQSLELRAQQLPEIQRQLDSAATLKDTADITARLAAEQNYALVQQAQAQNLLVSAQMQQAAAEQRQRQAVYQHNIAVIVAACADAASTGIPVVAPACHGSGSTAPRESYIAVAATP